MSDQANPSCCGGELPEEPVQRQIVDQKTGEILKPVPMPLVLQNNDRMTVELTAHHETLGESPITAHCQFAKITKTRKQPYQRRIDVGADLQPLHPMLVDEPGFVVLDNRGGLRLGQGQTEEEKAALAMQILVVFLPDASKPIPVPPKEFTTGRFPLGTMLRSASGEIRINLSVFPA